MRVGNGFQALNPPVKGIVLHLLEDFVCFAHGKYDTKYNSTWQERQTMFKWVGAVANGQDKPLRANAAVCKHPQAYTYTIGLLAPPGALHWKIHQAS